MQSAVQLLRQVRRSMDNAQYEDNRTARRPGLRRDGPSWTTVERLRAEALGLNSCEGVRSLNSDYGDAHLRCKVTGVIAMRVRTWIGASKQAIFCPLWI
jgi:hypothetical protein